MNGLRILITNTALDVRAGSELYVRDLATALLARGHTPIVYSPVLGDVAREIREATIPVVDDLAAIGTAPDVIHGHHHLETLTALLWFPGVPAVSMCHGWHVIFWVSRSIAAQSISMPVQLHDYHADILTELNSSV